MKKIIFGTLLLAGFLYADSIALNVNSDDIEIDGRLDITSSIGYGEGTRYFLGGDYLHTDNNDLLKVTFGASNTLPGAEGLSFTLGIEGVFADSFVAIPFFGEAALRIPFDEPIPPVTLSGKLSFAPSVLSFVDADNYLEYRFEADVEVISNIHVFAGYRNIDTDYENHDYTLNDSWYGGLKINF